MAMDSTEMELDVPGLTSVHAMTSGEDVLV